jgi:2'-5' RNA ligase
MSLFVAVRPDEDASADLQGAVERVRRLRSAQALRWQPPEHWHVTVAFLGDVEDHAVIDDVAERLDTLTGRGPVPGLRLAGAGCFGRQILWVGLGGSVDDLAGISDRIPSLVRGSGVRPDRRPWRPHLTLARARHGDARAIAGALADYDGPTWSPPGLLLIRSTGGPHPTHQVVHEITLSGSSGTA